MKYYEHRALSRSGQIIVAERWCEKHWQEIGKNLFDADTGNKEVHIYEWKDNPCGECERLAEVGS